MSWSAAGRADCVVAARLSEQPGTRPNRVEALPALPRNVMGKVRKDFLRQWLRGEVDVNDPGAVWPDRGGLVRGT